MTDMAWTAVLADKRIPWWRSGDAPYTIGLADRDEPGFSPMREPLVFDTYDEAKTEADARNAALGLTREEATKIVASSMTAQRRRK